MTVDAARFFDAIAPKYDRTYAPSREGTRVGLARVLRELSPHSRVLDLGVGTGRELPALLDAGHSPVGLDASEAMLALCARRSRPIPLVHADLWDRLPWDDASFDAAIALHGTLSHPPSPEVRAAFPFEVTRVLRPGGVFVAEVPTLAWFESVATTDPTVTALAKGHGRFRDQATGAAILAWFLSEDDWRALFAPVLTVRVDPTGDGAAMIVGRKM